MVNFIGENETANKSVGFNNPLPAGGGTPGPKNLGPWLTLLVGLSVVSLKNKVPLFLFITLAGGSTAYLFQQHLAMEAHMASKFAFNVYFNAEVRDNFIVLDKNINGGQLMDSFKRLAQAKYDMANPRPQNFSFYPRVRFSDAAMLRDAELKYMSDLHDYRQEAIKQLQVVNNMVRVVPVGDLPQLQVRAEELKAVTNSCGNKMFGLLREMSNDSNMSQTKKTIYTQHILFLDEVKNGEFNASVRANNPYLLTIEDKKPTELK